MGCLVRSVTSLVGMLIARPVGELFPHPGYSGCTQPVRGEGVSWDGIQCLGGLAEVEDAQAGVADERQRHQLLAVVPVESSSDVDEVPR